MTAPRHHSRPSSDPTPAEVLEAVVRSNIDPGAIADLDGGVLELLGYSRPDWHQRAACNRHDAPDMFPSSPAGVAKALACCGSCEVMVRCRHEAIEGGERFGVWGGVSPSALVAAVKLRAGASGGGA